MKAFQPYLFFNGNCNEAFTFYGKAFGVQPNIMKYSDAPPPPAGADQQGCGEGADMAASKDLVMHAAIMAGSALLMASDAPVGKPMTPGKGDFSVNIDCDSAEEQDKFFAALSEGGTVLQPLTQMFWGARFGMVMDKFGIHWMFNFQNQKQ